MNVQPPSCLIVLALACLPLAAQAQTYSRTETIVYEDNLSKWIVGQEKRRTCVDSMPASEFCNGGTASVMAETAYDTTWSVPITVSQFSRVVQRLTWDTSSAASTGQRGTVRTVADDSGNTTTLSSWKRGVPQSIKYPATPEATSGATESAVVDNMGRVTSVTDETGSRTCYDYDALGRITEIIHPSEAAANTCNTTAWAATTASFTKSATAKYGLPAGHWQHTVATGAGRKILYLDALWRPVVAETFDDTNSATATATRSVTVTRYDVAGRQAFQSYPMASLANYAATTLTGSYTYYDVLNRPRQTRRDWEGSGQLTTTTTYLDGFRTRVTNPRAQQTTTTYMAWDEPGTDLPAHVAHPAGVFTHITRDPYGKPTKIRRSNTANPTSGTGIDRLYGYNSRQELCRSEEPETDTTLMGYDAAGNLTWSASGLPAGTGCHGTGNTATINARKVVRTYDGRNRLSTLSFPDGRGNQTWSYAPDGLPVSIATTVTGSDRIVTNGYWYNRRRLLTSEQQSLTGWGAYYVNHVYNRNGHLSAHTYRPEFNMPDIDYAPNALGQPTRAGTFATGVAYYPNGAIKEFTYGNGIRHTLTQNARGLPDTSCSFYGSCNASAILNDGYDYDQNGNVAAISDGRTGNRGNRTMTYDALDRLTKAVSPMFGTATYAYDVFDNLTRAAVTGGNRPRDHYYCYDAKWHLTNVKTGSCSGSTVMGLGYDPQGNLANKSGQVYDFDFGNRLRAVTGKEDSYHYDGHGRRVLSFRRANGSNWLRSVYALDGRLLFQQDQGTATRKTYVYLGGSLIAERSLPNSGATTPASVRYMHTDALGSPIAITDENRGEVERTEYEPYGGAANRVWRNGPGYTGHVEDAATQLIYMQQRYYDSEVGRFLSLDPVTAYENPVGMFNRYKYAANNPYAFVDPDGRSEEAFAIAGEAFGFELLKRTYRNETNPDRKARLAEGIATRYRTSYGDFRRADRYQLEADQHRGAPAGIVYRRIDVKTGDVYIGRADSPEHFVERQKTHDKTLGVEHEYEVLARANPGKDLQVEEETQIRKHGGLRRDGGDLVNKRFEMRESRYRSAGGREPPPIGTRIRSRR